MRWYRIIRAINRGYALTVLWVYIAAFLVAMVLMFVHPGGTIILVWAGLVGIVLVLIVGKLLGMLQRAVARRALSAGRCPSCGTTRKVAPPDSPSSGACEACGRVFRPDGAEQAESGEAETTHASP